MNTRATKDEQIRWMNALNNASVLVASMNLQEGALEKFEEIANKVFLIEPGQSDVGRQIETATTVEQLEALKDAVRSTDKVSLFQQWNDKKIALDKK